MNSQHEPAAAEPCLDVRAQVKLGSPTSAFSTQALSPNSARCATTSSDQSQTLLDPDLLYKGRQRGPATSRCCAVRTAVQGCGVLFEKPPSKKEGVVSILPTIMSGLAGWLTFEDMRRKVRHHDESALYQPIIDIARDNGFQVEREFPLPRKRGQRGGPREVDFVIGSKRKKEFLALEVKFKKTARAMAGSIGRDVKKIRDIDGGVINSVNDTRGLSLPEYLPGYKLEHAVMIVWRKGDLVGSVSPKESPIVQRQLLTIMKCMFDDPKNVTSRMLAEAFLVNTPIKPVNAVAGHLRWGSTWTNERYWLAALRKRPSWDHL